MIRVAIVAGSHNDGIAATLKESDFIVEKKLNTVVDLWDDINDNTSDYHYIDKIMVVPNAFLSEVEMPVIQQVINLQSFILMNDLRSVLYISIKDSDLYKEIEELGEEALIYRNTNVLLFKELIVKHFRDITLGKYDAKGLYHPDFLRKNEIDAKLNKAYEDSELEYEPVNKEIEREVYNNFLENDEDLQNELKEIEKEERRNRGKNKGKHEEERPPKIEKEEKGKLFGGFGSKKGKTLSPRDLGVSQVDDKLPMSSKGGNNKKGGRASNENNFFRGIIAFTGDRQSGVSTTVSNTAQLYSAMGYRTLVIDLDYIRRTQAIIFSNYNEAIEMESRVANGLLVSLANPKNLDDVVSVVDTNLSVLGIDTEADRNITKFANRPFEQLYSASNLINLYSFAKSLYDVVLVDMPFEVIKKIGSSLSYVDRVIMCTPNTEHALNNLFEVELESLLLSNDLIGQTLISKSKLLLTKYNRNSRILNKEATDSLIEQVLNENEDHNYHLEVIGLIPLSYEYERQFDSNKRIVKMNKSYEDAFINFMEKLN